MATRQICQQRSRLKMTSQNFELDSARLGDNTFLPSFSALVCSERILISLSYSFVFFTVMLHRCVLLVYFLAVFDLEFGGDYCLFSFLFFFWFDILFN